MKFGASGLLRNEIAGGAKAEVFASANMEHPRSLSEAKRSGPVVLFARNRLCALARPGLEVATANVIDRMLDPQIKLGTSTPKADPSGDYAWKVFRRIDTLRAGSLTTLEVKALQLTGGPTSPKPPADRSVYGTLIERGEADLFLTYCTNALVAAREVAGAKVVGLPDTCLNPISLSVRRLLTTLRRPSGYPLPGNSANCRPRPGWVESSPSGSESAT